MVIDRNGFGLQSHHERRNVSMADSMAVATLVY